MQKTASVGGGVIGSSWAANFALGGFAVAIADRAEALDGARAHVARILASLMSAGVVAQERADAAAARVSYTDSIAEAVAGAGFIQESGPENASVKQAILHEIEAAAPEDTVIATSTSGLLITEIAGAMRSPHRLVGGHPYNPPHLIPLVEVVKGERTSDEAIARAVAFYRGLGKEPVVLRKEAKGFIANRLQMALYREVIDLVTRGVCSVEDADKALVFGPGLRWAIMGPNLIFHLGAGERGIRGLLSALRESSAERLRDIANWTEEPEDWPDRAEHGVLEEIANRDPDKGREIGELVRYRDETLIALLKLHGKL